MIKRRFLIGMVMAVTVLAGIQAETLAYAKKKKEATFKVRIENISSADGLETAGGAKYPFALSPGLFVVNHKKMFFFEEGKRANLELEAQAEDGNPEGFSKNLLTKVGSIYMGIFNKPVGADMPGPILPGGAYEFTFTAAEGMRLNLITMYGQSNDLFYAPKNSLDLFDMSGNPLTGDITGNFLLWDAGTEVNEAPGIGPDQAPRQKGANTGKPENGRVGMVKDGFTYPSIKDVLRITITVE